VHKVGCGIGSAAQRCHQVKQVKEKRDRLRAICGWTLYCLLITAIVVASALADKG